jgi:hypothetical protein
MKKDTVKDIFLEYLRKIPIVQVACEKAGIVRSTAYRWCDEDPAFKKRFEEALREGEKIINEMAKSQMISLMKDKHWPAISFWLRKRDPDFRDRLDINADIRAPDESLTPEQEAIVREALQFGSLLAGEEPEKPPEESPPQAPEEENKPTNQPPQA